MILKALAAALCTRSVCESKYSEKTEIDMVTYLKISLFQYWSGPDIDAKLRVTCAVACIYETTL